MINPLHLFSILHVPGVSNIFVIDEQLGQLYELMRAIQKRDSGEDELNSS